ncbi:hypothetical protein OV142_33995 [Nannocystis sp. SCPEA4]|nr:hypothetical protein [Nannocystis sp. SCPEA4]
MIKVGTLFALLALLTAAVMSALARRRAAAQEQAGGCVACGAREVEVVAAEQVCRGCGYVGRADRGGVLSQQEVASLHAPEQRDRW